MFEEERIATRVANSLSSAAVAALTAEVDGVGHGSKNGGGLRQNVYIHSRRTWALAYDAIDLSTVCLLTINYDSG